MTLKRKILVGFGLILGLGLVAKAGRAIYWNSLSPEQKVEKMTEKMGRWLALSDDQKPLVLELNRTLATETGDLRKAFRGHRRCQKAGAPADPAVQKWQDGLREVLTEEQERKLHF